MLDALDEELVARLFGELLAKPGKLRLRLPNAPAQPLELGLVLLRDRPFEANRAVLQVDDDIVRVRDRIRSRYAEPFPAFKLALPAALVFDRGLKNLVALSLPVALGP